MSENRRVQHRHNVSLSATLTIDGTSNDCTMLNISLGGAQTTAPGKYPMGQRVKIAFTVPAPHHAIEVGATVRWSNPEGLGIQFDGLRARDVWALNEYFKQLSP